LTEPQVYYEDVQEGMDIPHFDRGPIETPDILRFSEAVENFERLHHDYKWCIENGFPDVLVNGPIKQAMLSTMLTTWIGGGGFLKKLACQHRGMDVPGNSLTARGKVTKKHEEDGLGYVECDVWVENQNAERTCYGAALVVLPLRSGTQVPIEFPVPSEYEPSAS